MNGETRSVEPARGSLELWPDLPVPPVGPAQQGVGARQGRSAARQGGGGYLDECTAPELQEDLRFRELVAIGLSATWLATARLLGYDGFLSLWRFMSQQEAFRTLDGQLVMRLRGFAFYERFQRDLYIRRLAAQGVPTAEIHRMVRLYLGDDSTYASVKRVTAAQWQERRLLPYDTAQMSPHLQRQLVAAANSERMPDLFPKALEHALLGRNFRPRKAAKPPPKGSDTRLAELADIGLSAAWLGVARLVGYDVFVTLWRQWSADPATRWHKTTMELRLRSVKSFDRYQRNRYVETLVAAGLKPSEIRAMVRNVLDEKMTHRHLNRLIAAARVPA